MKSLCDEIRLRQEKRTDLISSETKSKISSEQSSDFIDEGDFIKKMKKKLIFMTENKLAEMSTEFVVTILNLSGNIKGHYSLCNQLERNGTSIGANIREAKYAHGRADFIAKLQIALKECYETEYWIEIAQKAGILSEELVNDVLHDCGSIRRC